MSLNIRKPDGTLQEIGRVTKEKVEAALGYEPANKSIETTVADNTTAINTHTENDDCHVTPADKQAWNEVTEVIEDTESEEFVIADPEGNKILQVDEDGLHTKIVNAEKVNLDGQDLTQKLSDLETGIEDAKIPSIEDNTDGKLEFTDSDGNIIARIDDQGLETHEVKAKSVRSNSIFIDDGSEDGINVKNKLDEVDQHISDHIDDNTKHVTAGDKEKWNTHADSAHARADATLVEKSDQNGHIKINDVETLVYTHPDGEHITADERDAWNKKATQADFVEHKTDSTSHITAAERTAWNNKFDGEFDDLKNSPFTQDDSGKLTITDTEGNIVFEINSDGEGSTNVYSLAINGQSLEDFIKEVAPEPEVITDAEIIALVNEVFPEEV